MDNHINITTEQHLDLWDKKFSLPNAPCLERDVLKLAPQESFTLICFDIVSLRTINDGYGRRVGDLLLLAIRDWVLNLNFGQLYRMESDEFALLLTSADVEPALEKAQHIYSRFDDSWDIGQNGESRQIYCDISIGVVSSETISSPSDILNVIERILKIASTQEEIAVYDEETNKLLKRHLEIEISLKTCVKDGMHGFSINYQPIVNCMTGLWCGIEALCRWNSPTLGSICPLEFIPVAEQLGLIGMIGEWVLETAIKQCKEWQLDTHEGFFLDINLSPLQLQDKNLDGKILDILNLHDYPSHKLNLEITESAQLNFSNHTLEAISRLTQHGIPVALDDFGTGYSSFHSLVNLPVSVLKTEKSFLNNIENDDYLKRLLETMVGLAHASGMKLTAEGVENAGQMKLLMDNRVDYVQGYLFSKPLSSEEFGKKLQNFYSKEETAVTGEYNRIDINSLLKMETAYSLTPSLYKALVRCMEILFNSADINDGINAVLALIGETLEVNRHVLFLKDLAGNTFTNTHEWCKKGTRRNIDRFKNINISAVTPNFIPLLKKEGMIISPDISALPEDICSMFQEIGVKSNIAIPLWRGKELLGYVGLEVENEHRNWLPEEVLVVHSVCGILANVLDRAHLQEEIICRQALLNAFVGNRDVAVYVSDLETDEILYANDTLQEILGTDDSLIGKICWKTIYRSKSSRCEFCTTPQQPEDPKESFAVGEQVHECSGRRYITYSGIIQWENNKKVRLGYAIDITRFQ